MRACVWRRLCTPSAPSAGARGGKRHGRGSPTLLAGGHGSSVLLAKGGGNGACASDTAAAGGCCVTKLTPRTRSSPFIQARVTAQVQVHQLERIRHVELDADDDGTLLRPEHLDRLKGDSALRPEGQKDRRLNDRFGCGQVGAVAAVLRRARLIAARLVAE